MDRATVAALLCYGHACGAGAAYPCDLVRHVGGAAGFEVDVPIYFLIYI